MFLKANKPKKGFHIGIGNNKMVDFKSDQIIESTEERKERFLLEFERPFKCEKCNERFKKKKYLREHKSEVHSY
ncbi:MAG: hypothetical protein WAL66_12755 [Nitrososphaeraceae archaeon]|jgi:uncharacterized Zn-finger protein